MIFLDNLYTAGVMTSKSDTQVSCDVRLKAESIIFKAHFPGEPIMPGASIVQMVVELYGLWRGGEYEICRVNNLKFLSVISPAEGLDLEVQLEGASSDAGIVQLKAEVKRGELVYTKMSLTLKAR